jgi:NADH dehydrogenase [ubiquinone] 1 alpha subcomplex assembly factor 7
MSVANIKHQQSALMQILRNEIKQRGSLSLAEYMNLCLSHPQHGYYMTRDPFGARGDFITAPEVSQMFGELIGAFIVQQWQAIGRPAPFHIIECGPGRGTLMKDALRVFVKLPEMMNALNIHLVEISPVLRKVQRETLKNENFAIRWHDTLASIPEGVFTLIANEFLDALPIHQLQFIKGRWFERRVGLIQEDLAFVHSSTDFSISAPENAIVEISPAREDFVKTIGLRLQKNQGLALLIDYGSDFKNAGDRDQDNYIFGDTLQAVRGHKFANIFDAPGECDLTSHVDFFGLKTVALQQNCSVHGPMTQRDFLLKLGVKARAAHLQKSNPGVDIGSALERLISPAQMGNLFKTMILTSSDLQIAL